MKTLKFHSALLLFLVCSIQFTISQTLTIRNLGANNTVFEHTADEGLTKHKGDDPRIFDRIPDIASLKKIIIIVPDNFLQDDLTFQLRTGDTKDFSAMLPTNGQIKFDNLRNEVNNVEIMLNNSTSTGENNVFKFSIKSHNNSNQDHNSPTIEFTPFPFPIFSYTFEKTDINNNHRILLIDATPRTYSNRGFSLKKFETFKKDSINLKHSKALVSGRSLSVFTKNISLRDLEYIRIAVNGSDYTYNAGVTYLFDGTLALGSEKESGIGKLTSSKNESELKTKDKMNQDYFALVLEDLKNINELIIEDYQKLQQYQSILLDSVKGKRLDLLSLNMVSQIASFTPKYLNITSFPLTIPNSDEVEISTEVKYKGGLPNSVSSGTFKTTGALSVNVGSAIYFTGLKNNDIYTEPLKVDNQPDELRAVIDEDDQLSVGVGINSEITYRTGSIFRPSVSIGFFIPFEEQITPFFAIGPGISIIDSKVSLSLSYGFAFGKINSIKEKYRDIDLTNLGSSLSNTDLIQGVWSRSWYLGIGVGFNMNSEK